jgi:hypothetical protein
MNDEPCQEPIPPEQIETIEHPGLAGALLRRLTELIEEHEPRAEASSHRGE